MPSNRILLAAALGAAVSASTHDADAQLSPKFEAGLRGGVTTIGSTLGFDCTGKSLSDPSLLALCPALDLLNPDDSSPDIFWLDDKATALIMPFQARTSATLDLPDAFPNATVKYARLYWAGRNLLEGVVIPQDLEGIVPDQTVQLDRPGVAETLVHADDGYQFFEVLNGLGLVAQYYAASADVTAIVRDRLGEGAYRVSNVDGSVMPVASTQVIEDIGYAAWSLVVVWEDPKAAFTRVQLLDGLDRVKKGNESRYTLRFEAPNSPNKHPAKLTLVAFEGDTDRTGDSVTLANPRNGADFALQNDLNDATNFFNSSRTASDEAGAAVAVSGERDVPRLTGEPDTMASFDLDSVAITDAVVAGKNAVQMTVRAGDDQIFLGALVIESRGCESDADCAGVEGASFCDAQSGSCSPCIPESGTPGFCGGLAECVRDPETNAATCACQSDSDCGGAASGRVCDLGKRVCVDGCRGTAGNGCPDGLTCSSLTAEIGSCEPCLSDDDCENPEAPVCSAQLGVCVCTEDAHCGRGERCIDGQCINPDGIIVLQGGGPSCGFSGGAGEGLAGLFASVASLAGAFARRRRRARA